MRVEVRVSPRCTHRAESRLQVDHVPRVRARARLRARLRVRSRLKARLRRR